jgi:heme/copper-type cytochrome/quinol oxidase subunit 4
MIGLLVFGLPLLGLSLWLYLRFAPGGFKQRMGFEALALFLLAVGIFLLSKYCYLSMKETNDRAWWPVAAFFYNLIFIPTFLLLAAVIRRLYFRKLPGKCDGMSSLLSETGEQ